MEQTTQTAFRARVRNGIDHGRLAALVESMEETNSEATTATFRVRGTSAGGLSAKVETQPMTFAGHILPLRLTTHSWTTDYPKAVQGQGQGPTPQEALLGALAADLASNFALQAAAQGVEVDAVRVEAHADLDLRLLFGVDERSPSFQNVHARIFVQSREDRDELEHVQRLAERTSAVLGSLNTKVRVDLHVAQID